MRDVPLAELASKIHFKKLTAEELRKSPSVNLVDENGEFVAILFVPFAPFPRQQVNSIAEMGNHALGKG